ncbi:hypothetical protein AVEN_259324-1 [Araneus ventricosus]|uniref:Uncharacterized protein n=1 Tax=Araneus ventricosus TaxID=182803 RepID=A0A4Y2JHH0_ARAVE|nr:hypothetical protein AVEN_259324-1 [Araneus ventricosus]
MVSASASEPVDREFYPGLCSYSLLTIVCNASLLQVRPMVTSKLALTCFKLAASLHSCHANLNSSHVKFVASLLHTKIAIWVGPQLSLEREIISVDLPYPMDNSISLEKTWTSEVQRMESVNLPI